jgi:CheY-like chemotaxis protein
VSSGELHVPNAGNILVVEDHADTSAALHTILTQRGYSVLTADDGQKALDLLDRGIRPRLILVDLLLPLVSGEDLLTRLNAHPDFRDIPTIVITAVPREQVRVITSVVFSKPLDYAKLTRTVEILAPPASAAV